MSADTPPIAAENTITMRDGGIVRGRVVTLQPGSHVDVNTGAGTIRLAWAEIVSAVGPSFPGGYTAPVSGPYGTTPTYYAGGSAAADLGARATDAPAPPVATREPEAGRVPVVFAGERGLNVGIPWLERITLTTAGPVTSEAIGRHMCSVPCTLYVAPGGFRFTVAGEGLRTEYQELLVGPEGMRVRLDGPPPGRRTLALGLAIGGGAAVIGGFVTFGLGMANISYSSGLPLLATGVGVAVAGIGVGSAGLWILLTLTARMTHVRPLTAADVAVNVAPNGEGGGSVLVSARF